VPGPCAASVAGIKGEERRGGGESRRESPRLDLHPPGELVKHLEHRKGGKGEWGKKKKKKGKEEKEVRRESHESRALVVPAPVRTPPLSRQKRKKRGGAQGKKKARNRNRLPSRDFIFCGIARRPSAIGERRKKKRKRRKKEKRRGGRTRPRRLAAMRWPGKRETRSEKKKGGEEGRSPSIPSPVRDHGATGLRRTRKGKRRARKKKKKKEKGGKIDTLRLEYRNPATST